MTLFPHPPFSPLHRNQIEADPLRLRQVLTNLSTNAMKFTEDGHIIMSVQLVELDPLDDYSSPQDHHVPHLLFRVMDTGIGMDTETMSRLFERFYQGRITTTCKVSCGSGVRWGDM